MAGRSRRKSASGRARARILVAEDAAPFRRVLERTLTKMGHSVVGVGNGLEALELLKSGEFHLLVLDIVLPGMLGTDILEHLREHALPNPPAVIAASGLYWAQNQEHFLRSHLGVSAFLRKPFSLAHFRAAVSGALSDQRLMWAVKTEPDRKRKEDEGEAKRFESLSAQAKPKLARRLEKAATSPRRATKLPKRTPGAPKRPTEPPARKTLRIRFQSSADFMREYADNIGSGGLFVPCGEPLEVGQHVDMELVIPTAGGELRETSLPAEIVYVRAKQERGPGGVGVQFLQIPEAAKRVFDAAVQEAHADARTSRPLLLLAYGVGSALDELRRAVPDADFRVRAVASPQELLEAAQAGLSDLVLLEAGGDGSTAAHGVSFLKGCPETARIPVFAVGPQAARAALEGAGVDRFFDADTEDDALVQHTAMLMQKAQRRRHIRVRFGGELRLVIGSVKIYADGQDLSEGGIAANARAELPLGQILQVEVSLLEGAEPLRERATVAWARKQRGGRSWALGLEFDDLSAAGRQRIRAFVSEAIRLANYARWMAKGGA